MKDIGIYFLLLTLAACSTTQSPDTPTDQSRALSDVVLTEKDDGSTVRLEVGQTLRLQLISIQVSGRQWEDATQLFGGVLAQAVLSYEAGAHESYNKDRRKGREEGFMIGGGGTLTISYVAKTPGKQHVEWLLIPFSRDKTPTEEMTVTVIVR